ncbi:hypothetical protein ACFX11_007688 [Malus domestica]
MGLFSEIVKFLVMEEVTSSMMECKRYVSVAMWLVAVTVGGSSSGYGGTDIKGDGNEVMIIGGGRVEGCGNVSRKVET